MSIQSAAPAKRLWAGAQVKIISNTFLVALLVAVAIIIVGLGFGYENNKVVPVTTNLSSRYLVEPHNPLSFMANWDGPDYLFLAQHGYTSKTQANFFPLYPALIRLVSLGLRSPLISSLVISWTALVGAVYFYLKIIKQLYGMTDNLEALRGVLFFVLFPTGVFLLASYTEALFAFLALAAVYGALRKNWLAAALMTMLATATHVNGLFVLVFVALLLWEEKEKLTKIAAGVAIGSLGLLAYMLFLQLDFHNALAFITSQQPHGWLQYGWHSLIGQIVSRKGLFLAAVIAAVMYWWRRRRSFAIYSLLYASIVLLGELGGYERYVLMAFPVQLMCYDYFRHKKTGYMLAIALSSIFWAYFLLQYAGGYVGG